MGLMGSPRNLQIDGQATPLPKRKIALVNLPTTGYPPISESSRIALTPAQKEKSRNIVAKSESETRFAPSGFLLRRGDWASAAKSAPF